MPPDNKDKPSHKVKKTKKEKPPSFEDALEELENMVETMESGQLPLEKLISSYERGAALINHCESALGDARKRLELITLKPTPKKDASDNDDTNTLTQEDAQEGTSPSNHSNDDEIRLF